MDSNQHDRYPQVTSRGNRKNTFNTGLKTARNKLKGFNRISNYINSSFQKNKNQLLQFDIQNTGNELTRIQTTFNENITINGTLFVTNLEISENVVIENNLNVNGILNSITSVQKNTTIDIIKKIHDNDGFNNIVKTVAIDFNTSNCYFGGSFTNFDNNTRNHIIKINSDGTENQEFYQNLTSGSNNGFNNDVNDIEIENFNNRILVVGSFTTMKGLNRKYIVRLYPNGKEDQDFYNNLISSGDNYGFNGEIHVIKRDPFYYHNGDRFYVGGRFTSLNGSTVNCFVRLNNDGTLDTTFDIGFGFDHTSLTPIVYDITFAYVGLSLLYDIYVCGQFNRFNARSVSNIVRLNRDGSQDLAFNTFQFNDIIYAVNVDGFGDVYLGGSFTTYNSLNRYYMIKLNSSGTENSTFTSNIGTGISATVGAPYFTKITDRPISSSRFCFGYFDSFNNNSRYGLICLNIDGTEDISFYSSIDNSSKGFKNNFSSGQIPTIYDYDRLRDNKIIIVGDFNLYDLKPHNGFVELNYQGDVFQENGFTLNNNIITKSQLTFSYILGNDSELTFTNINDEYELSFDEISNQSPFQFVTIGTTTINFNASGTYLIVPSFIFDDSSGSNSNASWTFYLTPTFINGSVRYHDNMGFTKQEGPNDYYNNIVVSKTMLYNLTGNEELYFTLTGVYSNGQEMKLEAKTSIYIQKIA